MYGVVRYLMRINAPLLGYLEPLFAPPLVLDITFAMNQIMAVPTTHSEGIFPLCLKYAPTILLTDRIAQRYNARFRRVK